MCTRRLGLDRLLFGGDGHHLHPEVFLDGLSTGPEREGVPVGQVGVVFPYVLMLRLIGLLIFLETVKNHSDYGL